MEYEWNDVKCSKNVKSHGIHFSAIYGYDWDSAIHILDNRYPYQEERWIALGYIKNRLHVLVYTRREHAVRIISLRKANKREIKDYEKNKKTD